MSISNIQPSGLPTYSWTTADAGDKECDFLNLRLLNKRSRARLSPKPLDLSVFETKGNYFVVSNLKGWFAAITLDAGGRHQIIFSTLADLKRAITSNGEEGELLYTPMRVLHVAGPPVHLALSSNDDRLVVGIADGTIAIFDTAFLFSEGMEAVDALKVFMPGPPGVVRQIISNPGDLPDLVAIRRDTDNEIRDQGPAVEIIDTRQLTVVAGWKGGLTEETTPTIIGWSAKGKQIAIGLKSGDIITYSPADPTSIKFNIPRPPCVDKTSSSIVSFNWLSNQVFFCVYSDPGQQRDPEVDQTHMFVHFDPKTHTAIASQPLSPYYPSPELRGPGLFSAIVRNWNPIKTLLFMSDTSSCDIGIVGSFADEDPEIWCNISLEETSTPSVPLNKDAEDTVPLALEMDFTSSDPTPQPVLFIYASDGTLQGWFISNTTGGPYPGMIAPTKSSVAPTTTQTAEPSIPQNNTPAFGQPSFATPTFGNSGFASTPKFGQSAFSGGGPAFNQANNSPAFNQASTSSASAQPSPGFGAFASAGPSKFGSTGFGFGKPVSSAEDKSSDAAASTEATMTDAVDDNSGMGGLSIGDSQPPKDDQPQKVNSMFGSFAQTPVQNNASGSGTSGQTSFGAFGSTSESSYIKPATGFGAFSQPQTPVKKDQPSAFETPKPSPAFGASGFGQPAFGQPAFGQPAFGQPAFGQPSFGTPSTPGKSSTFGSPAPSAFSTPKSGGFGSFAGASKGFGAFAQSESSFLQPAQSVKVDSSPSITMSTSTDDAEKTTNESLATDKVEETPSPSNAAESTATTSAEKKLPSSFGPSEPSSSPPTNVFGGSAFLVPNNRSSAFSTPNSASRTETPGSSPENSPAPAKKPELPPSNPPSPKGTDSEGSSFLTPSQNNSPFGASLAFKAPPGPSAGAFANLVSTPNAFKPAEGFGAFGSTAKVPSTSPFANPKPVTVNAFATPVKPVSAFAPGGSGPSSSYVPTGVSTTPKFGTPSALGTSVFGKPSFGVPSTPKPSSTTPASTPAPASNAFSAFSGVSGGFNAFTKAAGQTSSFKDLLKSEKDSTPESKPSTEDKKDNDKDKGLKLDTSFIEVLQPEELDEDNLPPTPSTHGTFDEDDQNLGEEGEIQETNNNDDEDSFLSESFSSDEDAENENEEDADGEELEEGEIVDKGEGDKEDSKDTTPAPSVPSKTDASDKKDSTTPDTSAIVEAPNKKPETKEESTTPVVPPPIIALNDEDSPLSGLFSKPSGTNKSAENASTSAPKPAASTSSIGLGRPSFLPTRVTEAAENAAPGQTAPKTLPTQSASILPRARPASPRQPFGQMPVKKESATPAVQPAVQKTAQEQPLSTTPKVPPPSSIAPEAPPIRPPVFRTPLFGSGNAAAAGNAPFIMPSSSRPVPPSSKQPTLFIKKQEVKPVQPVKPPQSQQSPSQTFESTMQKECQNLYLQMQEEIKQLEKGSKLLRELRVNYGRTVNLVHPRTDIGMSNKWAFGDLDAFVKITKGLEKDILAVYAIRDELLPLMQELESNLLKAETRKEEIVRFSKAKNDPEFSKMLKSRTLGPDAAETQSQLRRQIQTINNRVVQLEAHLKECKRKLEDHKKGKSSIKPPSLDTINRTYRNIDVALEAQNKSIEALVMRVAKLDINDINSALHGKQTNKPKGQNAFVKSINAMLKKEDEGKKPASRNNVTPSVAAWTAATLNAERSALRLKNALAKAREEPLLNTQAIKPAKQVPTLENLKTHKTESSLGDAGIEIPPLPDSQPPDNSNEHARRSTRSITHHAKPVKLGQTPSKPNSSIASFDWGPLPPTKPLSSLPFNLTSVEKKP